MANEHDKAAAPDEPAAAGPLAGREWCDFCGRETQTHVTIGRHNHVCLYCGSARPPAENKEPKKNGA